MLSDDAREDESDAESTGHLDVIEDDLIGMIIQPVRTYRVPTIQVLRCRKHSHAILNLHFRRTWSSRQKMEKYMGGHM